MDHVQSIEELMQEIDRLKALLQTKENKLDTRIANRDRIIKFKFPPNKKVKTNSQIGRLFGVSKDMINTIQSNFSKVAKKFKKAFNDYQANKEGANFQAHSEAINQNYNYDASIDEIIENFSKSLKEQQEKLNLKREKKQKASRVSARVTLSPKLLMNKVKKNFNKAKIVIMHQASSLSYTYGEYKERKAYERNQELADDLQYEVEKERIKQRKSDFKAAIKAEKQEEKERRHQAILDMIKALDQEQQQELESQRAEISNLQSEIMYNMREGGGRRR